MDPMINVKDIVYYARIIPTSAIYEVDEIRVRTVTDTYFVGTEKRTKQARLFPYTDIGVTVFTDRAAALALIKEAEKYKREVE